jgi:hypothetical protein
MVWPEQAGAVSTPANATATMNFPIEETTMAFHPR